MTGFSGQAAKSEAHSKSGNSSVGRARPCQGRGREFESRFPLQISPRCFPFRYSPSLFALACARDGFAIVDVLRVLSRYHEPHKTIETILTAGSLGLVDVEFPSDSDPSCMTLLRFDKVSLAFGLQPLLDEATFSVEPNERVCLIGR